MPSQFEFLPHEEQRAIRNTQRKGLLQVVSRLTEADRQTTLPEGFDADWRFNDKYGRLAERSFATLWQSEERRRYDQLFGHGEAVLNGFYILARIASMGPAVYAEWARKSGQVPSVDGIADMLKSSYDQIIPFFAAMQIRANTTYETNFDLLSKPGTGHMYGMPPFLAEVQDGSLVMLPTPDLTAYTRDEVARRYASGDLEPELPWRQCPAHGVALRELWRQTIDTCRDDPELFARDLETLAALTS